MKKQMMMLVIGVLTAVSALAQGGSNGGNGGKGVYCPGRESWDPGVNLALDYQRAYPEFGLTPVKDVPGNDEIEKALSFVQRLKRFNPRRAEFYANEIRNFRSNQHWVDDFDITPTEDAHPIGMCTGGKVFQVILQIDPKTPYQKRYVTHRANYNSLSTYSKAILIVHEVILRETRAEGLPDPAESAVMLNTFVMSQELDQASADDYAKILQAAGLLYQSFGIGEISVDFVKSYFNGNWNDNTSTLLEVAALSLELIKPHRFYFDFDIEHRIPTAKATLDFPLIGAIKVQFARMSPIEQDDFFKLLTSIDKPMRFGIRFFRENGQLEIIGLY